MSGKVRLDENGGSFDSWAAFLPERADRPSTSACSFPDKATHHASEPYQPSSARTSPSILHHRSATGLFCPNTASTAAPAMGLAPAPSRPPPARHQIRPQLRLEFRWKPGRRDSLVQGTLLRRTSGRKLQRALVRTVPLQDSRGYAAPSHVVQRPHTCHRPTSARLLPPKLDSIRISVVGD